KRGGSRCCSRDRRGRLGMGSDSGAEPGGRRDSAFAAVLTHSAHASVAPSRISDYCRYRSAMGDRSTRPDDLDTGDRGGRHGRGNRARQPAAIADHSRSGQARAQYCRIPGRRRLAGRPVWRHGHLRPAGGYLLMTDDEEQPDPTVVNRRRAQGAASDLSRMGIDPRSLGLSDDELPADVPQSHEDDETPTASVHQLRPGMTAPVTEEEPDADVPPPEPVPAVDEPTLTPPVQPEAR